MIQIVLIRPGSTDYNQQGRIQGTLDVPLNDQGNTEVARAIDQLQSYQMEGIYYSPCESAQQTAKQIASALNLKTKKLDKLQNLDHGLWQGMLVDEVKRKQPKVYRQWLENPETICPPDGEMLAEARGRLQAVLIKLLNKHKEGIFGLVVPEPLATLVSCFLSDSDVGDLWKTNSQAGSWQLIEVEPQSVGAQRIK